MPVDAYPDLSPPMVELITQWPGHAAEEVERLATLPLELAMNGAPTSERACVPSRFTVSPMCVSHSTNRTDPYFARQEIFQRIADAQLPAWRHAQYGSAVQPQWPGLSLRYRQS